jgi:SAM-dependent methyltransferase
MIISRDCAVCGSSKKKTIYSQRLEVPTTGSIPGGNDVVVCSECGFAYADNLPDQTALDQHYRHSCDSSEEAKRYDASEQAIIRFLRRGDRILDIGCGSGQLLCRIKDQGYGDVVGLEPSEAACVAAREQHGLNVVQGSLFDRRDIGRFDFVILSHVLEHVADLVGFLCEIRRLLSDGGRVFIEVPDAYSFVRSVEPNPPLGWTYERDLFAHFTPEHINFFSTVSLQNLMLRLGFDQLLLGSVVSIMGVITSVWQRSRIVNDCEIEARLVEYIAAARSVLKDPTRVIDELVQTQKEVLVWGAGLHTQRLLGCTQLAKAHIRAFIDTNPQYHGQQLLGVPIVGPRAVFGLPVLPIVISSRRVQEEIRRQIIDSGVPNPIVLLYPDQGSPASGSPRG